MSNPHDKAVLNSIFNPLLPLGEAAFAEDYPSDLKDAFDENTPNVEESKALELKGIQAAESSNIETAIALFSDAIKVAPARPSCYNNRAQALRLKGDSQGALTDLNNAINLSGGAGRSACQALCQRALLYLRQGQTEEARKDLEAAAKLGSGFARSQLAMMNPYAALCNKMLSEAFARLQKGD